MPRTFICSTGTSAAKLLVDEAGQRLAPGGLREWVAQQGGSDTAARQMLATFRDVKPSGDALHHQLSAEIHSLVRMNVGDSDRVVLLSSSTSEGLACALAVAEYLKQHWRGLQVVTEPVIGLQVDDAEQFRRVGVVEFTKLCLREINNYHAPISGQPANVVLNPTGGFKALVPYMVLVGMLKKVPCRYIFEQSTTLLQLPPLPVEFSHTRFEAHKALFEHIERESLIPLREWEKAVHFEERISLEPLIEQDEEHVALSAIGTLFLDEVRQPKALVPFLSRQTWNDCWDNLSQLKDCDPFRFLERMTDLQMLEQHQHINAGNGLRWLKPGRTTDRYLVSVEDWRLLVWRAIREDEIGSDYPQQVVIDPQRDRSRYSPFTRMEFTP